MTCAAARRRVIFRRVVLRRWIECQSGINFKTALGRRSTSDRPRYCTQTRRTPPLPLASTAPSRAPRRASSQLTTSQCQTDRVIIPKHAGLRRCHWPRPRQAAPLAALARSWRRHNDNLLPISATNQHLICAAVNRRFVLYTQFAVTFDLDRWPWPTIPQRAMVMT